MPLWLALAILVLISLVQYRSLIRMHPASKLLLHIKCYIKYASSYNYNFDALAFLILQYFCKPTSTRNFCYPFCLSSLILLLYKFLLWYQWIYLTSNYKNIDKWSIKMLHLQESIVILQQLEKVSASAFCCATVSDYFDLKIHLKRS